MCVRCIAATTSPSPGNARGWCCCARAVVAAAAAAAGPAGWVLLWEVECWRVVRRQPGQDRRTGSRVARGGGGRWCWWRLPTHVRETGNGVPVFGKRRKRGDDSSSLALDSQRYGDARQRHGEARHRPPGTRARTGACVADRAAARLTTPAPPCTHTCPRTVRPLRVRTVPVRAQQDVRAKQVQR